MKHNMSEGWIKYLSVLLDESFLRLIHKQSITDLTIHINEEGNKIDTKDYSLNVYTRILNLFESLKELNVVEPFDAYCPAFSLQDLPSTAFFSSTLLKLSINVANFDTCLRLLDGRLEQICSLSVRIPFVENQLPAANNSVSLYCVS